MKKIFLMRIFCLSFLIFFLILGFFIVLPSRIFSAKIPVINEFLAHPSSGNKEWVEFYNPENVDLSTYFLDDDTDFGSDTGSSSRKSLSTINNDNSQFQYFELSSFLNNGGDYVVLFSPEGEIIDQYQYNDDPGENVSVGRFPDGAGEFNILSSSTKGSSNSSPFIPTSTPLPTNTIAPTKTPTLAKTPTTAPTVKSTTKVTNISSAKPTSVAITSKIQKTVSNSSKSVLGSKNEPTINLIDEKQISTPTPDFKNSEKMQDVETLGATQNNLPKILIGAGIIFIALCAILFGRSFRKKISNENE